MKLVAVAIVVAAVFAFPATASAPKVQPIFDRGVVNGPDHERLQVLRVPNPDSGQPLTCVVVVVDGAGYSGSGWGAGSGITCNW